MTMTVVRILAQRWRPVALSIAMDLLHQALHTALHQRIAMAIEMASKGGVFFDIIDLSLLATMA